MNKVLVVLMHWFTSISVYSSSSFITIETFYLLLTINHSEWQSRKWCNWQCASVWVCPWVKQRFRSICWICCAILEETFHGQSLSLWLHKSDKLAEWCSSVVSAGGWCSEGLLADWSSCSLYKAEECRDSLATHTGRGMFALCLTCITVSPSFLYLCDDPLDSLQFDTSWFNILLFSRTFRYVTCDRVDKAYLYILMENVVSLDICVS